MRIFLIGYMGCGKSTFGNQLSMFLNIQFFELDTYIENKYRSKINKIFEKQSEEYFRKIEHESLIEIVNENKSFVLSTGGGTPCFYNNMEFMLNNGVVKVPAETIYKRLILSKKERPLLKNKTNEDIKDFVYKTLTSREEFYNKAHIIVDSLNLNSENFINYLKQLNISFDI